MVHSARYSIESLHGVSWAHLEGHSVGNKRLHQGVMSLPNSELRLSKTCRAIVYKYPYFHLVGTPLKLSLKATVPARAAGCANQLLAFQSPSPDSFPRVSQRILRKQGTESIRLTVAHLVGTYNQIS